MTAYDDTVRGPVPTPDYVWSALEKMQGVIDLKVHRLCPYALLPTYATDGSACFDLYALLDSPVTVKAGKNTRIQTGLAFEIPKGWVMLVFSRSGHGFKNGVRLSNSVGVIDSDYRGELLVSLEAEYGHGHLTVEDGDRIAQAMLVPSYRVQMIEVDLLSETARGSGGFGSSGA